MSRNRGHAVRVHILVKLVALFKRGQFTPKNHTLFVRIFPKHANCLSLFCVCEDFSVSSRWFLLRRKKRDGRRAEALIKNERNNEGGWRLFSCSDFFSAGKLLFLGGPKHLEFFSCFLCLLDAKFMNLQILCDAPIKRIFPFDPSDDGPNDVRGKAILECAFIRQTHKGSSHEVSS